MNARKFFELVAEMRNTQRKWYQYHYPNDLTRAKNLEKEVDREIQRVRDILERKEQQAQGQLFSHENQNI